MTTTKKSTCIMICAGKGDLRAARGLASRALKVLGIKGHYFGSIECEGSPRYIADMNEHEFAAFVDYAKHLASKEGWSVSPLDIYRD
jgi:hypothetical protein